MSRAQMLKLTLDEESTLSKVRELGGVDVSTYRVALGLNASLASTVKLLEKLVEKGRITMHLTADRLEREWSTV